MEKSKSVHGYYYYVKLQFMFAEYIHSLKFALNFCLPKKNIQNLPMLVTAVTVRN